MINFKTIVTAVIIFLLLSFHSLKSQSQLSPSAKISLLTCDPGDEVYSLFGHSAIWVYDQEYDINEVFNYGTFDYDNPDFLPKFLRGKLLYWLHIDDGGRFMYIYGRLKRGVRENVLNLNSIEKMELYTALKENAKPENRSYLYDFWLDNCSTRISEILENNFGPYSMPEISNKTFRDLLHEYMEGREWTSFGIDLIIGSRAEEVTTVRQQMFLPDYLSRHLSQATDKNGQKVMNNSITIVNHPWHESKSFWITPFLLFSFLLLLEIIIVRYKGAFKWVNIYDNIWMIVMAMASLILLFMWFGTDHQACGLNYNLITFSPLIILWLVAKKLDHSSLEWIGLAIILPMLLLPFVKMTAQNIPSATLPIALITALKIFRSGALSGLRKWV